MKFGEYLLEQLTLHPSMGYADIVKLCYQAAFGAEHLVKDKDKVRGYLESEYENTEITDAPLYEIISEDICRVNLSAWKRLSLPLDELLLMFLSAASLPDGGDALFAEYLIEAESVIRDNDGLLSVLGWQEFLREYKAQGAPPVHHSEEYRKAESPSYRLVRRSHLSEFLQKSKINNPR